MQRSMNDIVKKKKEGQPNQNNMVYQLPLVAATIKHQITNSSINHQKRLMSQYVKTKLVRIRQFKLPNIKKFIKKRRFSTLRTQKNMSYELGNEIYVTNWNKNQMIDTSFGSTILLEESVKAILQDILPTNIKNNSLCLMEEKVKTFYSRSNTVIEYLYSTSPDPREMRYPLGQLKQSRTE